MINRLRLALLTAPLLVTAAPAAAHHAMGGRTPSTFMEGFLSGLAHPVIGLDHLAFLVAIGIVVGIAGLSLLLPLGRGRSRRVPAHAPELPNGRDHRIQLRRLGGRLGCSRHARSSLRCRSSGFSTTPKGQMKDPVWRSAHLSFPKIPSGLGFAWQDRIVA
jgi:hypothetical protein